MEVEIRGEIDLIRTIDRQVPHPVLCGRGGVKGPNQKRYFVARFPLANSCAGKPIRHTQGRKSREARDRTAPRHRPGGALQ